jgi:hypothetical protein
MSILPKVNDTYFSEREGVLKIALELNRYGLVFRETPNGDVGIDGQIEYVNKENQALGKIVAVQIKSGDSYLTDKDDYWAFYPKEKHRIYWESYPIPVILLVYSPSNDKTYFVDARYQLSIPEKKEKCIRIPKTNVLSIQSKELIFESFGPLNEPFLSIEDLFNEMINKKCTNPTFLISYFDLFINGLTNICRQLFFSISLACDIAEFNNESEFGMSIGSLEHEFLHDYVKFLVSQNIANIDYADYLIDWNERELQPTFIATITQHGKELMDFITEKEKVLGTNLSDVNIICERFLKMDNCTSDIKKFEKAKIFRKHFEK